MPGVKDKTALGRQVHIPFKRAFDISMKNLKIRLGRSIITASGIFLGIAFLSTVLSQSLMEWPTPEKFDSGLVRVTGQVNGPGDFEVWKPVPIEAGLKAGIPKNVIDLAAKSGPTFQLRALVQGRLDAMRADKNLARVNEEWKSLGKVKKSLYDVAAGDKDIQIGDAVEAGVPPAIARHLAGEGKTFKTSALADAVKIHPNWIKIWASRASRTAIYKSVDQSVISKLSNTYAIALNDALKDAKGWSKDADRAKIMIVNTSGTKLKASFANKKAAEAAGTIKLNDGDNIMVADRNTLYRTVWLVVMSLLVCAVGITNSMLMSVTERFKEIGTMKCLGALDGFVYTLLLLESSMMGIIASVAGWLIGFLMMALAAGFTRGWSTVGSMGFVGVMLSFVECVVVGMLLTIIATLIPAKRAADMPAAMALRSEI